MSKVLVEESNLSSIASAIRSKVGVNTMYKPSEMAAAINGIDVGITPSGSISITENGAVNVTQYASAAVNVPNSYSASDEGKVVSNGALVAQTARASEITKNGTYDTTLNNEIVVDVSGGGGGALWNHNFAVNWNFSNPANTQGSQTYNTGSQFVETIDGWRLNNGILTLYNNGINVNYKPSFTQMRQLYSQSLSAWMVGVTFTLSLLINNELETSTFVVPSSNNTSEGLLDLANIAVFIWKDSSGVSLYIQPKKENNDIINGIKLEVGSTQTLATQINGVWTLNNTSDPVSEKLRSKSGITQNT